MNLWAIVQHASPVNQAILLFLLLLSILSWGVVIERWRYFAVSKGADVRFFKSLRGRFDAMDVYKAAREEKTSPSGRAFMASMEEMQRLDREDATSWSETLETERSRLKADGERGLPLLAIIASTAPFIGLLGTVWGVMLAFLKLGQMQGQPALEVVGPGIAEALVATAMGLMAAIPAMMAYNAFVAAQRNLLRRAEEFTRRLMVAFVPTENVKRSKS
ncbi:MAG: MotA/TolQ/ExbB proton channel family protein [bacterium]